jgi:hypothetical protein
MAVSPAPVPRSAAVTAGGKAGGGPGTGGTKLIEGDIVALLLSVPVTVTVVEAVPASVCVRVCETSAVAVGGGTFVFVGGGVIVAVWVSVKRRDAVRAGNSVLV